jgi:type IV pilus assembly protein PilO
VSGRTQTIVAAACAVVVLLAFFFLFIRPRRAELARVRNNIEEQTNRTQALQAELDRLESLRDNAPKLQAELQEMHEQVPEENDVSSFIFSAQSAANQAGVGFVQITPELPKQPPEGGELAEVRTTIGAKGGYFAVQDFIRRMYDFERAVRIDSVTVTGVEDEEQAAEEGRTDVQMVARIFFEPPAGAAPADPAAAGSPPATTPPAPTP